MLSAGEDMELKLSHAASKSVKWYNHTANYVLKLNKSIPCSDNSTQLYN